MPTQSAKIAANAANMLRTTLYFWWIAYLRQSKDYWWICQEKGNCQDDRLISVWQDFGDLFSYQSLDQWWQSKGKQVFELKTQTQAPACEHIPILTKENLPSISLAENLALMSVRLDFSIAQIQAAFLKVLRQLQRERSCASVDNDQLFKLPYALEKVDFKSKKALITSYQVHLLQLHLDSANQPHSSKKWGCYEMAIHLGIAKQQHPKAIDTVAMAKKKQNCLRVLVCQNKSIAKSLIANVEVGRFPYRDPVTPMTRWNQRQEKARNEAIADGAWHQPNWLSDEFAFLNPHQARLLTVDSSSPKEQALSVLEAFKAMPTPFLLPKRKPKNAAQN